MTNSDKTTAALNTAIIIIGSYHLPASVAVGALVGASLFILNKRSYSILSKIWLFAISYLSGLFGGEDVADFINWFFPDKSPLDINDFTGAAMVSALVVVTIQYIYRYLDNQVSKKED